MKCIASNDLYLCHQRCAFGQTGSLSGCASACQAYPEEPARTQQQLECEAALIDKTNPPTTACQQEASGRFKCKLTSGVGVLAVETGVSMTALSAGDLKCKCVLLGVAVFRSNVGVCSVSSAHGYTTRRQGSYGRRYMTVRQPFHP